MFRRAGALSTLALALMLALAACAEAGTKCRPLGSWCNKAKRKYCCKGDKCENKRCVKAANSVNVFAANGNVNGNFNDGSNDNNNKGAAGYGITVSTANGNINGNQNKGKLNGNNNGNNNGLGGAQPGGNNKYYGGKINVGVGNGNANGNGNKGSNLGNNNGSGQDCKANWECFELFGEDAVCRKGCCSYKYDYKGAKLNVCAGNGNGNGNGNGR